MKMLLIKEGGWGIVSETEDVPDEPGLYRKYLAKRDRALSTIVLGIDHSLLYLIGDPEDPVFVWRKLEAQFQRRTWANKLSLRRKLYGLKLKENEDVQGHIKSMIEVFDELAVIGDEVEEEDRVVHVLASLPDSFNVLVTALEANAEVPPLEIVIERLLHEQRKINERCEERKERCHDALIGRYQKSSGPVCYNCKKSGHIKRHCKAKMRSGKESPKKNNKIQESITSSDESEEENDYVSDDYGDCEALIVINNALSVVPESSKNKWIIDSGASKHMCNDRTMFTRLKDVKQPQMVKVGNGYPVRVKGIGNIKLTTNTKKGGKKCVLKKVLFVPDLSFNLLSVSRSTKVGKLFEFSKETCTVKNNKSGEVVATGTKIGNLYHLDTMDIHEAHSCLSASHTSIQEEKCGEIGNRQNVAVNFLKL